MSSLHSNESNFYILHQLLHGLRAMKSNAIYELLCKDLKLNIENIRNFDILSNQTIVNVQESVQGFDTTLNALHNIGCDEVEIHNVFSLLACILHLGNAQVFDAITIHKQTSIIETIIPKPSPPLPVKFNDLVSSSSSKRGYNYRLLNRNLICIIYVHP